MPLSKRWVSQLFVVKKVGVPEFARPEGAIRLAVMAGESIYANVRLRLAASQTYKFIELRIELNLR